MHAVIKHGIICYVPSTFAAGSIVSIGTCFGCSSWISLTASTGGFGASIGARAPEFVGSSLIEFELSIELFRRPQLLNVGLLHSVWLHSFDQICSFCLNLPLLKWFLFI